MPVNLKKQKIDYLIRSIKNIGQEKICPFCGGKRFQKIDRKYLFTSLLQCEVCKLNHRHPKDNEKWLRQFYQKEYHLETHIFTQLPSDEEIKKLRETNFPSQRSYDGHIDSSPKTAELLIISKPNIEIRTIVV